MSNAGAKSDMTNSEPTTVTDIGRMAGCSIATVSRVLNNSGAVSAKKRAAILKAIQDTQFYTSRARRGGRRTGNKKEAGGVVEIIQHRHSPIEKLSLQKGQLNVGPLVHATKDSEYGNAFTFYRNIVDGVIEELARWGYRAQMRMNSNLLDPALLADINGPDRTGVLLIGEYSNDLEEFVKHCHHPIVLVDLIGKGMPDVVTTDNYQGITEAFTHLFNLGHRKIGYVGQSHYMPTLPDERYTSYKLNMTERGLALRPDWIYNGADHIGETAAAVTNILRLDDRPTALMCANDCYALGVVRAASAVGLSIPDQLSVVGFDDSDFAAMITPPLTTVRVPVQEMGRQGVRQLMISLKGGTMPSKSRGCHVRLLPELIVRESTAAVKL